MKAYILEMNLDLMIDAVNPDEVNQRTYVYWEKIRAEDKSVRIMYIHGETKEDGPMLVN